MYSRLLKDLSALDSLNLPATSPMSDWVYMKRHPSPNSPLRWLLSKLLPSILTSYTLEVLRHHIVYYVVRSKVKTQFTVGIFPCALPSKHRHVKGTLVPATILASDRSLVNHAGFRNSNHASSPTCPPVDAPIIKKNRPVVHGRPKASTRLIVGHTLKCIEPRKPCLESDWFCQEPPPCPAVQMVEIGRLPERNGQPVRPTPAVVTAAPLKYYQKVVACTLTIIGFIAGHEP